MSIFEISQTLLHRLPTTFNIHELTRVIDRLEPELVSVHIKKLDTKPCCASWGTGVYELQDDGCLILIASWWDTD